MSDTSSATAAEVARLMFLLGAATAKLSQAGLKDDAEALYRDVKLGTFSIFDRPSEPAPSSPPVSEAARVLLALLDGDTDANIRLGVEAMTAARSEQSCLDLLALRAALRALSGEAEHGR
jgi:hypothetical protein